MDIFGYLKNTHKNPKFGKVRRVPTREFPTKFPDWDSSHSSKFGIFVGILSIPKNIQKWESVIFSCDVTCILHLVSFLHVAAFFWELIHPLHTTANTDNNSQHCLLTICWELLHPFARRYNNIVKWFLINLCSLPLILNLFFGILHSCIHHFYPQSPILCKFSKQKLKEGFHIRNKFNPYTIQYLHGINIWSPFQCLGTPIWCHITLT